MAIRLFYNTKNSEWLQVYINRASANVTFKEDIDNILESFPGLVSTDIEVKEIDLTEQQIRALTKANEWIGDKDTIPIPGNGTGNLRGPIYKTDPVRPDSPDLASAKTKLRSLGLTDAEITAIRTGR